MNSPQLVTAWPPSDITVETAHTIPASDGSSIKASILICRINSGAVRVGDTVFLLSRPDLPLQILAIEPFEVTNQAQHKAGLLFKGIDLSFVNGGEAISSHPYGLPERA